MNYYVNGEIGADTNDGLSWETAFATVQKALDVVQPDDEDKIYVEGEASDLSQIVYIEYLTFKNSATLNTVPALYLKEDGTFGYNIIPPKTVAIYGLNKPKIYNDGSDAYLFRCQNPIYPGYYLNGIELESARNFLNMSYATGGIYFEDCDIYCLSNTLVYFYISTWTIFKNCKLKCPSSYFYSNGGSSTNGCVIIDACDIDTDWNALSFAGYSLYLIIQNIEKPSNGGDDLSFFSGFTQNVEIKKSILKDIAKDRYMSVQRFENNLIHDLGLGYELSDNGRRCTTIMKNLTIKNDVSMYRLPVKYTGCVFLKETDDIFEFNNGSMAYFEDCIFKSTRPSNIPEENFVNCVFETDPLLDFNYIPTSASPCYPKNWTGEEPIKTYIGWKIPDNIPPEIFSVYLTSGSGDIPIAIGVVDPDTEPVEFEIKYGIVEEGSISTWNDCTLKYARGEYGVAGDPAVINNFLWDSLSDISTDSSVKIKARVSDGYVWSDWLESSEINVLNENPPTTMIMAQPIEIEIVEPETVEVIEC